MNYLLASVAETEPPKRMSINSKYWKSVVKDLPLDHQERAKEYL